MHFSTTWGRRRGLQHGGDDKVWLCRFSNPCGRRLGLEHGVGDKVWLYLLGHVRPPVGAETRCLCDFRVSLEATEMGPKLAINSFDFDCDSNGLTLVKQRPQLLDAGLSSNWNSRGQKRKSK